MMTLLLRLLNLLACTLRALSRIGWVDSPVHFGNVSRPFWKKPTPSSPESESPSNNQLHPSTLDLSPLVTSQKSGGLFAIFQFLLETSGFDSDSDPIALSKHTEQ